ncbi:hypothetical protein AVEN_268834-1 [Araneus ventricosus]|uniref:Uncharacterized protein n=1 Tax=Araneus ventricosus TaxID=182803 RepID=A0A4Y2LBN6_ARAVE|nr:hypothetical protein AVEN_268834-1 [Araneus ventricosus]
MFKNYSRKSLARNKHTYRDKRESVWSQLGWVHTCCGTQPSQGAPELDPVIQILRCNQAYGDWYPNFKTKYVKLQRAAADEHKTLHVCIDGALCTREEVPILLTHPS